MFKFFSIRPAAEEFDADTGTYADGMTDRFYRDLTGRNEHRFRSAHERDYGATREINEFATQGVAAN